MYPIKPPLATLTVSNNPRINLQPPLNHAPWHQRTVHNTREWLNRATALSGASIGVWHVNHDSHQQHAALHGVSVPLESLGGLPNDLWQRVATDVNAVADLDGAVGAELALDWLEEAIRRKHGVSTCMASLMRVAGGTGSCLLYTSPSPRDRG